MHLLLATFIALAAARPPADPALHDRLLALRARDQQAMQLPHAQREVALRAHLDELRALVAADGWPPVTRAGADGAQAAWLVVQHADFDPAYQRAALDTLRGLLALGEANPDDVAYLEDRVARGLGRRQLYGTQGECRDGAWHAFEIHDAGRVDTRRRAAGLEPIADYTARATRAMCGGAP